MKALDLESTAKAVHRQSYVVDAHGHTLQLAYEQGKRLHESLGGRTDLPMLRAGGVTAQIFASCLINKRNCGAGPGAIAHPLQTYLETIAYFERELKTEAGEYVLLATTPQDIETAKKQGKVAGILGLEGADSLEGSLENLRMLYGRGLRHVLLCHEGRNEFACAPNFWTDGSWTVRKPDRDAGMGLSSLGRELVRKMNRLGMLVDVSHLIEPSFWDVLDVATKPVIASHSNARSLVDTPRHLRDDQIRAVAKTGGVVAAVQASGLEGLLNQIGYLVQLVGSDHVGFGTDFSGGEGYGPAGLEDISKLPNLTHGLLARGYDAQDIGKILGGNFVRLFTEVVTV